MSGTYGFRRPISGNISQASSFYGSPKKMLNSNKFMSGIPARRPPEHNPLNLDDEIEERDEDL